ncbi:MAG TPA: AraC family transcriptional regulator [Candidatus Saccharimonadia bacterium]|nr:AraC family transcriptional regulator [Candidatus Saccharimonadia bacterium]
MSDLQASHRDAAGKVAAILDLEFENPRVLEALAGAVGLSPYQLSRAFHAHHGVTIPGYLRRLRMNKAAKLMAATDLLIGDIARSVGYASMSAFNRAFIREMHKGPSEYRESLRASARPFASEPVREP